MGGHEDGRGEESQRRQLLAGAVTLVEAIQDVDQLLRWLTDLLVPEFADLAAVDRIDGETLTPVVASPDEDETRCLLNHAAPGEDGRLAPHLYTAAAFGLSVIVAPIPGRFKGNPKVLRLARRTEGWSFDGDDRAFVEQLGHQIGIEVGALRSAHIVETAQETAEARARRLQRLTTRLSEALTPAQVSEVTVEHAMAALDASAAWLARFDAAGTHLELAHAVGVPAEVRQRFAWLPVEAPSPVAAAARTSEAVWFTSSEEALAAYPELTEVCPEVSSAALLPLAVGEQTLGGMGVCLDRGGAFSADERGEVLAIVGLCAQALERALRFDAAQQVAAMLQRSLLPHVPDVGGVELYTRYLAATAQTQVGGDWYDVIPVNGDQVALVVGDVAGHGMSAATVMGQLHTGLRAYLLEGHEPAAALQRTESLAGTLSSTLMTTVWCGILDPATGRLCYANAAHPSPAVASPTGEVGFLDDGRNPPIGLGWGGLFTQAEAVLDPAATLVCYTDGLIERRGEHLDDGMARLAAALRRTSGRLKKFDEHLLPLPGEGHSDDVALLAVHRESLLVRKGDARS